MHFQLSIALIVLSGTLFAGALQDQQPPANITTSTKRLFAYAGPLLPSDWTLVSVWNDRAVIGFSNGSARNSLLDELETKDRVFLQRLQNGTLATSPLTTAKETLSKWSSTITSTVSKYGGNLKDQLDKFIKNNYKGDDSVVTTNTTTVTLVN